MDESSLRKAEKRLWTPAQNIQKKAETVKEQVKQQVIDKATEILPENVRKTLNIKTTPPAQTSQPKTNTQTPQKQQSVEERLKEELQKGIQKGLGDLFRR